MNNFKKNQLICRTCLKMINDNELYTNAETVSNYGKIYDILEACVSELNLDLTDEVVMCCNCFTMLRIAYDFKVKCLSTEERVFTYLQKRNLSLSDKIHLSDVIMRNNSLDTDIHEIIEETDANKENVVPGKGILSSCSISRLPAVMGRNRKDDMYKPVNDVFGSEFYTKTQSNTNISKQNEYLVMMFDNSPLLDRAVGYNYSDNKSDDNDCNMIMEKCRLNSRREEYFDALFDSVSMSDYVAPDEVKNLLDK